MTSAPNWDSAAPPVAVRAVLDAIDRTSTGDRDGCCLVLADSVVDQRWLMIVGVDCLAGFCKGPYASAWWARLRAEAHELALQTGASDSQLRCCLHVIALAEARERGAMLRVYELQADPEFAESDIACAACLYAGMVAAHRYGDALAAKLAQARRLYGEEP